MKNVNGVSSIEQGCAEDRFEEIIGNSPALESVLAEVQRVAIRIAGFAPLTMRSIKANLNDADGQGFSAMLDRGNPAGGGYSKLTRKIHCPGCNTLYVADLTISEGAK